MGWVGIVSLVACQIVCLFPVRGSSEAMGSLTSSCDQDRNNPTFSISVLSLTPAAGVTSASGCPQQTDTWVRELLPSALAVH